MASARARTFASVACLAAYLSACSSWHTVTEPPERVIVRDRPSRVRLTTEDGKQVLQNPEIRADTLAGTRAEGDLVAVALDDVWGLEVRKTSTWKTIGLVYLLLNVVVGIALVASGTDVTPDFEGGG